MSIALLAVREELGNQRSDVKREWFEAGVDILLYSSVHHILMKLTVVAPTIRYSVEFLFIFWQRVVGIIQSRKFGCTINTVYISSVWGDVLLPTFSLPKDSPKIKWDTVGGSEIARPTTVWMDKSLQIMVDFNYTFTSNGEWIPDFWLPSTTYQFPQLRNISLYSLSDHYVQGFRPPNGVEMAMGLLVGTINS